MSKPFVLKFLFNLIICHPPESKLLPSFIILRKELRHLPLLNFLEIDSYVGMVVSLDDSLSQSPLAVGLQLKTKMVV